MDDSRLKLAESVFDELVHAPAEQRMSLLDSRCSGDAELRGLVERLVKNDDSGMGEFLRRPVLAPDRFGPALPARLGNYEIISEIGRGGAGVVYEARQGHPSRTVALKVLDAGFASNETLWRFQHEAEVLGSLQHPGIAQIYEAATVETQDSLGHTTTTPCFAMERVDGEPITDFCRQSRSSISERLALFVQVCRAVQHAHTKGVIHRDIKPSNVLAGMEAGRPFCKIIDFGIAKVARSAALQTERTQVRQIMGTPDYMSPEQAAGNLDVDTRTDVYSLGVLLYELLTGLRPFDSARLGTADMDELRRIIREENPPLPSTRTPNRELRGELDWIVMKCLEKDRARRYESPGALAADIERYLSGQAIEAAPPSATYRARKFVRRHRGFVVASAVVASVLLVASGVSIWFGRNAEKAEVKAKGLAAELEQVARFQESQLSNIDPQLMGARMRAALLGDIRDLARQAKLPAEEANARAVELEKLIAGSDFTGMALNSLADNFFTPALTAIEREFGDRPLVKARLLQSLATTLNDLGLIDAASAPQEEALNIRRRLLGEEHRDTLGSTISKGLLLLSQGELAEAEFSFRQAHETALRVLGEDDPVTLSALGSLGVVLHNEGRLKEAEVYSRASVEKNRRVLGEDDPETLKSISNLGTLLNAQARHAEAEPYFREALEKSRGVLGEEHPDTLMAINNLGALLLAQGKFADAEPFHREALEKARRVLGNEHPSTLMFINNMGFLHHTQEQLAEAEPYYREALETRRRILGDDHPKTLNSMNNLAGLLKGQGKFDEAGRLYREALNNRRRFLGDEHADTIGSINNMGWLLEAEGKLDEAEPYYREALDKHRRVMGPEHPSTLVSIHNMSSLLLAKGKPAEALPLLAPAEPVFRRVFTGGNSVRLGRFLILLGRARIAVGEFDAAEANLSEANDILNNAGGASEQQRREVMSRLVELYDAWNAKTPDSIRGAKAAQWRSKLSSTSAASQSATNQR